MNIATRPADYWQAIIFDFDGVIVESGDIKAQAFAELYRHHGETIAQAAVTYHRANRFNALVGYKTDMFSVGGEYFYAENWNAVTSVNAFTLSITSFSHSFVLPVSQ